MKCHQAKTRLHDYGWRLDEIGQDSDLSAHIKSCQACRDLVEAELALQNDLTLLKEWAPETDLDLAEVRTRTEAQSHQAAKARPQRPTSRLLPDILFANASRRFAVGALVAVFAFLLFVPLNFQEQVGYQIAIDGVGKDIAVDNQQITSLLGALGMESNETTNLLDSLGNNQITFSIGECSETCRLTISDLKTERDVRLMIKAIIDLGCCRINGVKTVFKSESTSILEYTAKKLLS